MSKTFNSVSEDATAPAREAFAITPSDGADLTRACRSLWVGVAGTVTIDTAAGDNVAFTTATDGVIIPIQVKRVYATGTTATGLVGLY